MWIESLCVGRAISCASKPFCWSVGRSRRREKSYQPISTTSRTACTRPPGPRSSGAPMLTNRREPLDVRASSLHAHLMSFRAGLSRLPHHFDSARV